MELGYWGGYLAFARVLRRYKARSHREPCRATSGRDLAIIAHLLVGALAHSRRWWAVLAEAETFPCLVQSIDAVLWRLGGAMDLVHAAAEPQLIAHVLPLGGTLPAAARQLHTR
ncbi:hypothetical protein [Streptomyces sp. NPDC050738]|uniref:hypothetical protein n=1 Tax=Streptomyces sp. NPDC050738 TaxID=3154744 RepID=UPI00342F14EA